MQVLLIYHCIFSINDITINWDLLRQSFGTYILDARAVISIKHFIVMYSKLVQTGMYSLHSTNITPYWHTHINQCMPNICKAEQNRANRWTINTIHLEELPDTPHNNRIISNHNKTARHSRTHKHAGVPQTPTPFRGSVHRRRCPNANVALFVQQLNCGGGRRVGWCRSRRRILPEACQLQRYGRWKGKQQCSQECFGSVV